MNEKFRITYATMSADNEGSPRGTTKRGIELARAELGATDPRRRQR